MSKIFKNEIGYTRISKEEYSLVLEKFLNYIQNVENSYGKLFLKFEPAHELDFKEEFGDIDFIGLINFENSWSSNIIEAVTRLTCFDGTKIEKFIKNADCLSMLFVDGPTQKKYHIDIVITGTELKYNNYIAYYCNSVVNNFLGQFLKSFNIKAGHNGIYYQYKDKRGDTIKIFLEEDYHKFFREYFNLDLLKLRFDTYEKLLNFLINVEFFPGSKRYIEHRSSDKKRAIKMHGLMNKIYIYLENLTEPKYVENKYQLQLHLEHQKIVDEFIRLHEIKKDINIENRNAIFEFLKVQEIHQKYYQEIFKTLMPILNKEKYTKNNILEFLEENKHHEQN